MGRVKKLDVTKNVPIRKGVVAKQIEKKPATPAKLGGTVLRNFMECKSTQCNDCAYLSKCKATQHLANKLAKENGWGYLENNTIKCQSCQEKWGRFSDFKAQRLCPQCLIDHIELENALPSKPKPVEKIIAPPTEQEERLQQLKVQWRALREKWAKEKMEKQERFLEHVHTLPPKMPPKKPTVLSVRKNGPNMLKEKLAQSRAK